MNAIAEAADRMRKLGLMPNVVRDFERSGTLYYSEKVGFPGVLYWVSNDEWLEEKVGEFEKEYGAVVFHVVMTKYAFGRVYSFLYVCEEDGETSDWESERAMLAKGQCPAWCENRDAPECSEFGYIGVRPASGGLDRTW